MPRRLQVIQRIARIAAAPAAMTASLVIASAAHASISDARVKRELRAI